jgi:hypothetical protein
LRERVVDSLALKSYLDKKGKSGITIDSLILQLSMSGSLDSTLISSQSSYRLPPLKKILINDIPPSSDNSLKAFLSNSTPKLQIFQLNVLQFSWWIVKSTSKACRGLSAG